MQSLHVIKDSIPCDTTVLQRFVHDPDYYYDREIVPQAQQAMDDSDGYSWFDRFIHWLDRMLTDRADIETPEMGDTSVGRAVIIILAAVIFVVAMYFLLRYLRNSKMLFWREKKSDDLDYELEEDTIYDVDFTAALAAARRRHQGGARPRRIPRGGETYLSEDTASAQRRRTYRVDTAHHAVAVQPRLRQPAVHRTYQQLYPRTLRRP